MSARAAGTPNYVGSATANSKAGPVEDTDLFNRIFDDIYEQYQKGYMTKEIDQLSAKLASVIPKQESAKKSASPAEPTADLKAEYCHFQLRHKDSVTLQGDVVETALVGFNLVCSLSLKRETYTVTTQKQRKS